MTLTQTLILITSFVYFLPCLFLSPLLCFKGHMGTCLPGLSSIGSPRSCMVPEMYKFLMIICQMKGQIQTSWTSCTHTHTEFTIKPAISFACIVRTESFYYWGFALWAIGLGEPWAPMLTHSRPCNCLYLWMYKS